MVYYYYYHYYWVWRRIRERADFDEISRFYSGYHDSVMKIHWHGH